MSKVAEIEQAIQHLPAVEREALESRLDRGKSTRRKGAPQWMRAYGALRHLRRERKLIERAIESEFETIEPEDRL